MKAVLLIAALVAIGLLFYLFYMLFWGETL
jgi:hypothetical protein